MVSVSGNTQRKCYLKLTAVRNAHCVASSKSWESYHLCFSSNNSLWWHILWRTVCDLLPNIINVRGYLMLKVLLYPLKVLCGFNFQRHDLFNKHLLKHLNLLHSDWAQYCAEHKIVEDVSLACSHTSIRLLYHVSWAMCISQLKQYTGRTGLGLCPAVEIKDTVMEEVVFEVFFEEGIADIEVRRENRCVWGVEC